MLMGEVRGKMWTLFLTVSLCVLGEFLIEAEVNVELEDLAILNIDPKYFDPKKTECYIVEDEETEGETITTTLAIVKKPPPETEIRLLIMGLSMGKYDMPTGVNLNMTVCEAVDEKRIMGQFFSILGFTRDSCPPEPGMYHQEGYQIPVDRLPDEFPENKYLVHFDVTIKEKEIFALIIYVNVQIR